MIKIKNYIPRTVTKFTSPVTGNRAVKATRQFGVDADGKLLNTVPQRYPAGNIDPNLPSAPAHKTGMDFNRSGEGTTAFTARAQMKVARDVSTPRRTVSADDYPVKRSAESERMRKAAAEHDAAIEADKNLTPAGTMSAAEKIAAMRAKPAPAPLEVHKTANTPVGQSWEKEHSAFYKKAGAVTVTKPTMEQAVFNFLSKKQFDEQSPMPAKPVVVPTKTTNVTKPKPRETVQNSDYKARMRARKNPVTTHEESDYTPPKLGTVKANLMHTQEPTVQVQVFKHNTLRGDSYWVTKEARKFKTMDQAQAYVHRINKQGVAEGVEVDEVITLNDSFEFGLDLNESYDFGSYLSAAKTIYDEEDAIQAANESYKNQDTEIFFEAFAAEQMEIIIAEEEALGNEVSDAKYSIDGNNAQIEYVVTEAAGMRKKYVHRGSC